jgi:dimethylargininase
VRIAITRPVSASLARCELTHLPRVPIDAERAVAQHAAYEETLVALGCRLVRLPEEPDFPDAVFVEDTAIVLDELGIITRPGAASRRAETTAIAEVLARFRKTESIEDPATLDGGDVLRIDRQLYVGRSSRTSDAGIAQLRALVEPHGYDVYEVPVAGGCLHLKSAVTELAPSVVLLNPAWVPADAFARCEVIDVPTVEPAAANVLRIDDTLVMSAAFPRTQAILAERGYAMRVVDVSELQKAEGGVTCCSLVFQHD